MISGSEFILNHSTSGSLNPFFNYLDSFTNFAKQLKPILSLLPFDPFISFFPHFLYRLVHFLDLHLQQKFLVTVLCSA